MGRSLRALVLCAVGVVAIVAGTNLGVRASVANRAHNTLATIAARPVAIVPGSPTSAGKAKALLEGRLRGALALYRSGRAGAVLISGIDSERDPETTAMRAWLEEHGVPSGDIIDDDQGTRTRETMRRAWQNFGIDRAIVCTEALAMPRALFLAKHNGIDAVGLELPSPLSRHPRWIAIEALKTTLAFFEETFAEITPGARAAVRVAMH
jgi:vancomycin permeability regulator SanA